MALPEIFFVSDEVLEMLAEVPQAFPKVRRGALHHGFDHLFDEGDLFLA